MDDGRHIIRNLRWEVETADLELGHSLPAALSDWWHSRGLRTLDTTLTASAPSDDYIAIRSVSIDLGHIPRENWEDALQQLLAEELKARLPQLVKSAGGAVESSFWHTTENALLFFLESGRMPWWHRDELAVLALLTEWSRTSGYQARLLALARGRREICRRILHHLPDDALLEFIPHTWRTWLLRAKKLLPSPGRLALWEDVLLHAPAAPRLIIEALMTAATMELVSGEGTGRRWDKSAWSALKAWSGLDDSALRDGLLFLLNDPATNDVVRDHAKNWLMVAPFPAENRHAVPTADKTKDAGRSVHPSDQAQSPAAGSSNQQTGAPARVELKSPQQSRAASNADRAILADDLKEGVYVPLAGLVLTHPFLTRLFQNLGYCHGHAFTGEEARQKAARLLAYLGCGEQYCPEYDMPIPKLLTGMKLEEALPPHLDLSDKETEEGNAMLKALIQHWGALKNSSPEALRQAFFQRMGKLVVKEDKNAHLHVEQAAQDVLLQRLPWGNSFIQLPWCGFRFYVDWY